MKNINRPANPVTTSSNIQQNGLTKLEYAAIHILAGLLANPDTQRIYQASEDAVFAAKNLLNQTDIIEQ